MLLILAIQSWETSESSQTDNLKVYMETKWDSQKQRVLPAGTHSVRQDESGILSGPWTADWATNPLNQ